MAKSQKYLFLQALIITFVVFNVGIYLGYKLESYRVDKINNWYLESEQELLDEKLQIDAFETVGINCDSMVNETINFADRIFEEAMVIGEYEQASRIDKDIISLHKKYDLLRTLLWINSIKIKEKCNSDYHNLVYFYQYNDPTIEQKAKQRFFSNLLAQVKEQEGNKVILIPIAADNGIASLNLLEEKYGIDELPAILIDENVKITDVQNIEDVEKYLN